MEEPKNGSYMDIHEGLIGFYGLRAMSPRTVTPMFPGEIRVVD